MKSRLSARVGNSEDTKTPIPILVPRRGETLLSSESRALDRVMPTEVTTS
ncbi:MAG: hypothetical protein ABI322_07955 [Gemmatimonadaceae bacterium]